jgi:hypothetical protein
MKTTTTRTLNPLPFQHLEPHRFEDLIRQLAYDFREWKSLEAIGRSGSDEGQDIRGAELVRSVDDGEPSASEEDDQESSRPPIPAERLWVFQCKPEKTLSPARIREVAKESLAALQDPPHGFVIAAACDVEEGPRRLGAKRWSRSGSQSFSSGLEANWRTCSSS